MWICLDNAFLSVVQDKDHPERLLVRARRKNHLSRVFGKDVKILTGRGTDYKYRTFISRDEFALVMAKKIGQIDYTNFKSHVHKKDEELSRLYGEWWFSHHSYQEAEGQKWGYQPMYDLFSSSF